MDKVLLMRGLRRLRRTGATPVRRFFDPRFSAVGSQLSENASEMRADVARAEGRLLAELDRRMEQISFDLAASARGQLESMSYVAAELTRLESGLGGELRRLRAEAVATWAGRGLELVTQAYALRTLGSLPGGASVLAGGDATGPAALSLAILGHDVTLVAPEPLPLTHERVRLLAGEPAELAAAGRRFDAVVIAPAADATVVSDLLTDGGIAVVALDGSTELDGLAVTERAGIRQGAAGDWLITSDNGSGPALVTAHRG
jgi:hypothetical protein